MQKGYGCYYLVHNRYYVSTDLSFFEEKPYFLQLSIESQTIPEVFLIRYFSLSLSPLQESISVIDSTPNIPEYPSPELSQRPLNTYQRHARVPNTELEGGEGETESCPTPVPNPTMDLPDEENYVSIALRKCTRSAQNPHPIYNLSWHRLSPSYYSFVLSFSSISIPKILVRHLIIQNGEKP